MKDPYHHYRKNLLIAAFSLLAAFGAAEIVLRFSGVRFDASLFRPDTQLGWTLRPGAHGWNLREGETYVTINDNGQRDRGRKIRKSPGEYRIAVLGDSVVEARQVALDDTFCARTERTLKECPALRQRSMEVLNFGVSGFGTGQELLLLRSKVWEYQPDMVILAIYLGNDLFDNYYPLDYIDPELRPHFVLKDGELVLDEPHRKTSPLRARVRNFLADLTNGSRVLLLLNAAKNAHTADRFHESVKQNAVNGIPPNYLSVWSYLPASTHPALEAAWQVTEALVLSMRSEVETHSARFLLINMPMAQQVEPDPDKREAFRRYLGLESISYPSQRLERLAKQNRFAFLDLSGPMGDVAVRNHIFLDRFTNAHGRGHMNEMGHRVAAEFISKYLCENL